MRIDAAITARRTHLAELLPLLMLARPHDVRLQGKTGSHRPSWTMGNMRVAFFRRPCRGVGAGLLVGLLASNRGRHEKGRSHRRVSSCKSASNAKTVYHLVGLIISGALLGPILTSRIRLNAQGRGQLSGGGEAGGGDAGKVNDADALFPSSRGTSRTRYNSKGKVNWRKRRAKI